MTPHAPLPLQIVAGLVAGTLIGLLHFTALRWNMRLLAGGTAARAGALLIARFAVLTAVFVLLAKAGAAALLCGALGLLLARHAVLRRAGAVR